MDNLQLNEMRCNHCNALLLKYHVIDGGVVETVCRRCKTKDIRIIGLKRIHTITDYAKFTLQKI